MLDLDVFRDLLGPGGVLTSEETAERPAHFRLQSLPRTAIGLVRPRTTEEVSAILRICNEAGQPVAVQGGLSALPSSASAPNELALSLERMNQVEEVNAIDRVAVVQAGCILETFQEAVHAAGLYYGVDYGGRSVATVGGNVSTNAGGMNVLRYGMTREQVLGLEVVLADGTILSSMNRMLKNTAGYDLKQLFIGTEGTLGVVTRAVLRLRPLSTSENNALVACASFPDVVQFLTLCQQRFGETLTSFEIMWREYYERVNAWHAQAGRTAPLSVGNAFYANIETRGSNPDTDADLFQAVLEDALERGLIVDAVLPKSEADAEAIWRPREDMDWATYRYQDFCVGDISLPISAMEGYVADLSAAMKVRWPESELYAFGHIADGNVHILAAPGGRDPAKMEECYAMIYAPISRLRGSMAAEHGIGRQKIKYLHHSRTTNEIELMRTLKRTLDPRNILNAGRVVEM